MDWTKKKIKKKTKLKKDVNWTEFDEWMEKLIKKNGTTNY